MKAKSILVLVASLGLLAFVVAKGGKGNPGGGNPHKATPTATSVPATPTAAPGVTPVPTKGTCPPWCPPQCDPAPCPEPTPPVQ